MLMQGDTMRAEVLEQAAFELWREVGRNFSVLPALNLAYLALQRGDVAQARVLLIENFTTARARPAWLLGYLAGFAGLAATEGQAEQAARLFGAAQPPGDMPAPAHRYEIARHIVAARALLGDAAFEAAWAAGREMTLEQAIAEALGEGNTMTR
jgi:hypothetical protein